MYSATYDEWQEQTDSQPKGLYVCLNCGAINDYFANICQTCEIEAEVGDE